jgi:putative salt-induced outer membrane protein YdiY
LKKRKDSPASEVGSRRSIPDADSIRGALHSGLLALLTVMFFTTGAPMHGAQEDQRFIFLMRNGDRLTGVIVAETEEQVTVRTVWDQHLEVPKGEIQGREPAPKTPAEIRAEAEESPDPTPPPGTEALDPPITPAVAPKPAQRWHGDLQFGMDVGFSERNRQLYHGRAKITYMYDRLKNVFEYNAAYGKTDRVLSANRMDGSAKTDVDLGEDRRVFVYNLAGVGYDEIRRIDFRYEIGPGIGYHLITRTNFVLNVETGVNYQAEHRADDTTSERYFLRLAQDLTWKISSRLSLDEKLEFFPRLEDPSQFRIRFETNIRYWLRQNLSLNLSVLDVYDTDPARGVNKNDLQIRSSVGLKF